MFLKHICKTQNWYPSPCRRVLSQFYCKTYFVCADRRETARRNVQKCYAEHYVYPCLNLHYSSSDTYDAARCQSQVPVWMTRACPGIVSFPSLNMKVQSHSPALPNPEWLFDVRYCTYSTSWWHIIKQHAIRVYSGSAGSTITYLPDILFGNAVLHLASFHAGSNGFLRMWNSIIVVGQRGCEAAGCGRRLSPLL